MRPADIVFPAWGICLALGIVAATLIQSHRHEKLKACLADEVCGSAWVRAILDKEGER